MNSTKLIRVLAIAAIASAVVSAQAPKPQCGDAHASTDDVKMAPFVGPKANSGAVVMSKTIAGVTLKLTEAFKTPDTPDPHWQVVDREGRTYLLQRIEIKDMMSNRSIILPDTVTSVAKVQIWCAFAETNLGEATFETPKASEPRKRDAMAPHAERVMTESHKSGAFSGPVVTKGTVTHTRVDGVSTLAVSEDFVVPETPDPHWAVVDSKGRMTLLNRLPIKDGKVNRKITIPETVTDVASVRIWCAFAEVNLGEAKFEHPVK